MKLFLAILSLVVPAALAATADAGTVATLGTDVEHRALLDASVYDVSGLLISMPNSNTVDVVYDHGQGGGDGGGTIFTATKPHYQLFEGSCPTGDNVGAAAPGYASAGLGTTTAPGTAWQTAFSITLDPSTMTGGTPPLAPSAQFCILVGLLGVDNQLVNFLEVLFTIDYDLSIAIPSFTFTTAALDPTTNAAGTITVAAILQLCSGNAVIDAVVGATPNIAVNQDDIVCFRICSGDAAFVVGSVVSTNAANDATPSAMQPLVDNGGLPVNNQVTSVDATGCRKIEFMLDADFFSKFVTLTGTDVYPITTVSGTVNFVDARRRLGERGLQSEVAPTEFELELELLQSEDSGASAVLTLTSVATAAGVAGAAFLL